jgi:AbiV family abortive infection protein
VTTSDYQHGRAEPRLSQRQRFETAGASLTNATALMDDALVLQKAGRYQRAAFLAGACLEESLKAYLCLTRDPQEQEEWARFWGIFRDHRLKLALLKETEPGSAAEHDAGNRTLRTLRERNLYVDVVASGDPMTPMGLVAPGEMGQESIDLLYRAIRPILAREIERLQEAESTMRGST